MLTLFYTVPKSCFIIGVLKSMAIFPFSLRIGYIVTNNTSNLVNYLITFRQLIQSSIYKIKGAVYIQYMYQVYLVYLVYHLDDYNMERIANIDCLKNLNMMPQRRLILQIYHVFYVFATVSTNFRRNKIFAADTYEE